MRLKLAMMFLMTVNIRGVFDTATNSLDCMKITTKMLEAYGPMLPYTITFKTIYADICKMQKQEEKIPTHTEKKARGLNERNRLIHEAKLVMIELFNDIYPIYKSFFNPIYIGTSTQNTEQLDFLLYKNIQSDNGVEMEYSLSFCISPRVTNPKHVFEYDRNITKENTIYEIFTVNNNPKTCEDICKTPLSLANNLYQLSLKGVIKNNGNIHNTNLAKDIEYIVANDNPFLI